MDDLQLACEARMISDTRGLSARMSLAWLTSALLLLSACGAPPMLDIPVADSSIEDPRGISSFRKWAVDRFLGFNTLIGTNSGYIAVFARDGQVVHATTSGYADIESGRPMQLDTRVRIASMTKTITAVAALILVEEGLVGLDDPVERYIPAAGELRVATSHEFDEDGTLPTAPLARPLTVRDLLTFASGIGDVSDPSDLGQLWAANDIYASTGSLADRVDRVMTLPLFAQPGEVWRYGWSADVLARVIEVAAEEPFQRFLESRIFTPLGMTSTSFRAHVEDPSKLATVYMKEKGEGLVPVPSPPREPVDWTPGGGGLVSTAGDYMRFALMLWNGGTYDGVQILSEETVELMTQVHVRSGVLADRNIDGVGWGLGLAVVADADATPMVDRNGDFWWSGYYSTTFFVSPETGLVGLVLAQNEPGLDNPNRPYAVHIAPAFVFMGL
jgi:CubicO group peptidase (beta-lactamase class C family)